MSASEEEDEEDKPLREENVKLLCAGRTYNLQLLLRPDCDGSPAVFNVTAHATLEKEKIGYLIGHLLERPNQNFWEYADAISEELERLASTFCDLNGVASRVEHPRLKEAPPCVSWGGFLHIETIEVKSDHQGHDLGLQIIHETLVFLKNDWSLVVMEPGTLSSHVCKWKENSRKRKFCQVKTQQDEAVTSGLIKISRHWARMGFAQAGRSATLCSAWFMTSDWYFQPDVSEPNDPKKRWIPKNEASSTIDVYVPPKKVEPTGLDKELVEAVQDMTQRNNSRTTVYLMSVLSGLPPTSAAESTSTIESLVKRGASIDKSHALHMAAANSNEEASILEILIRLGGNVDSHDDDGNTPLHVAAGVMTEPAITVLVRSGASLQATNLDGDTPLQSFMKIVERSNGYAQRFRLPPREVDVLPKLACARALMAPDAQAVLLEGWLSPRMREVLRNTAQITYEEITTSTPVELHRMECTEYIPEETLTQVTKASSKKFYDGWGAIFCCVAGLLNEGLAPTVQRIKDAFTGKYDDDYQCFIEKGGLIEFALDAILDISENILIDPDILTDLKDIDFLPTTPLDMQFDIARFMCIMNGGGTWNSRGPYDDENDHLEVEVDEDDESYGDY